MTSPKNPASPALENPLDKAPELENLDSQSVAGEEDPGAALDMPVEQPEVQFVPKPSGAINPGDEAAKDTPGTGENICRKCSGSGRTASGPCPLCDGSGKATAAMGGI